MSNHILKIFFLIYYVSGSLILLGCKDKDKVLPGSDKGIIGLNLQTFVGPTRLTEYGQMLRLKDGRQLSVTFAQMYLSNFQAIMSNGTVINIPDSTLLQKPSIELYSVANVPAGEYKGFRFRVGFTSSDNERFPDLKYGGVLLDEAMWTSYHTGHMGGYRFVNFQGKIDTTATASGSQATMQNFKYFLGLDNASTEIQIDKNFKIDAGKHTYVSLNADYGKLLTGIAINGKTRLSVTTPQDHTLAESIKMKQNIVNVFQLVP